VESNSALSFVEECCVLKDGAECVREDLFQSYREYCNKNGLKPMSQANFNKDVEAVSENVTRGLERVSRRKIWCGIRPEG
jgi:putative DNA primase/helicase